MALILFLCLLFPFSSQGRNNQVLTFEFDENDGTTTFTDLSFTGNNGSCTNCPTIEGMGSRRFGNFDGANDVINVTSAGSLNFGTSDFTLSAWILMETSAAREAIIDKSGNSNDGYSFWISNADANRIGFLRGSTVTQQVQPSADHLVANRWHHVVAAINTAPVTDTVALYDNGAFLVQGNLANTATSSTQLSIGGTNGTDPGGSATGYFDGWIDYVRIFNVLLKDRDVRALYLTDLWEMRWEEMFEEGYAGRIRIDKLLTRTWSPWPTFL